MILPWVIYIFKNSLKISKGQKWKDMSILYPKLFFLVKITEIPHFSLLITIIPYKFYKSPKSLIFAHQISVSRASDSVSCIKCTSD